MTNGRLDSRSQKHKLLLNTNRIILDPVESRFDTLRVMTLEPQVRRSHPKRGNCAHRRQFMEVQPSWVPLYSSTFSSPKIRDLSAMVSLMSRSIIFMCMLLAGCASDVRDTRLADIDLRNMETVQEISARLPPAQRAAFANYVLVHNAASAGFCGRALARSDGTPPETIGEAIELSRIRDAEMRRATNGPPERTDPGEEASKNWDDLIVERDMLIDAQSILRAEHGVEATRLAEWKSLQDRMVTIDRRLLEMKPKMFGPAPPQ